jgi:hypothetical protein
MGHFGRRMNIRLSFDIYVITIHTQAETHRDTERERDRERGGWFAFWIAITKAIRFRG